MMRLHACLLALAACGGSTAPLVDAPNTDGALPARDAARDAPVGTTAPDPALDGTAAVTTSVVTIPGATASRTLPATLFTPAGAGPRPLVVISPGFQMDRGQYTSYAHHLATWGFVVVLTDYADRGFFADHQLLANDVTSVIDWALAQAQLAIAPQGIAVAGHSLGGKVSLLAASDDPRIAAVVAWDPVDSTSPSVTPEKMSGVHAAIAIVGETTNGAGGGMPCAPAAENFQAFYAAAASPAMAVTVAGADHMDWVDDPSCGFCGFCAPGAASPELARTVTRRLDVAWLRRTLLDDVAMQPWLDAPPQLATGEITLLHK